MCKIIETLINDYKKLKEEMTKTIDGPDIFIEKTIKENKNKDSR